MKITLKYTFLVIIFIFEIYKFLKIIFLFYKEIIIILKKYLIEFFLATLSQMFSENVHFFYIKFFALILTLKKI